MRTCAIALFLLFVPAVPAADDKDAKPITPEEAAKRVNEKVIVEMEVKSTGMSKSKLIFLNSEANYRDGKNFAVVIDKAAAEKFKKAKIDDPAAHFKGKIIQVTGKVTLYMNRPEIRVDDPEQIKVVEKKN